MRLNVSDDICDGNELPYGVRQSMVVSVSVEDKLYCCCEARRFNVATTFRKANSSVMFRFE